MEKHVGRDIEIFYQDLKGDTVQRTIRVLRVFEGKMLAYDYAREALRPFRTERILSLKPVGKGA